MANRSAAIATLRRDLDRIKLRRESMEHVDREAFDWFGTDPCSCGLEPGQCSRHPKARPAQRPPEGDWRVAAWISGRGAGKTRTAAEIVQARVMSGQSRRIGLIGATAADVRDVMLQGESGLLSIAPPWFRPIYKPSLRRLDWPNGAYALTFSGEEPERLRGPQTDLIWADELCAWQQPARTWQMAQLGLRLGSEPRSLLTTTPKNLKILKAIIAQPGTVVQRESTFANQIHLAGDYIEQVSMLYAGTRLGDQELEGQIVTASEGQWFISFDRERHVSEDATYAYGHPVTLSIDAGTSRCTAACWFQLHEVSKNRFVCHVIGDYYAEDVLSETNALNIAAKSREICGGQLSRVYIDPASKARTSIGAAAYQEYERVFGRQLQPWPPRGTIDGLNLLEIFLGPPERTDLLIHPSCTTTIEAFEGYERQERQGEYLDIPKDPMHPFEDGIDCLKGGLFGHFPEGRKPLSSLRRTHISNIF